MKATTNWFDIDKTGLAKLRAGTPKVALIHELAQNAWDTAATECSIALEDSGTRGTTSLKVKDNDPDGFKDLTHAYTLFAESEKKADPTKRGRFNLGEKLVLAMCRRAVITTTKGQVAFLQDGTRQVRRGLDRYHTKSGSAFVGEVTMGVAERNAVVRDAMKMIPPSACRTTVNGVEIVPPQLIKEVQATLPTVIGDEEGVLRPSRRKTAVEIRVCEPGEESMIYEMGIPVVSWGGAHHINVMQKVPLTLDRTAVTPAFLREVCHVAAEAMLEDIDADAANSTWVREAMGHKEASKQLVQTVVEQRFGKDAVVYDPNDKEANKIALDKGRQVIHGSNLHKEEWENVRRYQIAQPAGRVFTEHKVETSPEGRPMQQVKEVSYGMLRVAQFARELAQYALGISITVDFVSEPIMLRNIGACYGGRKLTFNVGRLGKAAFEYGLTEALLDLIIHELAHEKAKDHLSREFSDQCTAIGAKAVRMALARPHVYQEAGLTG